mmetsp:Transcript_13645/g.16928  ORF Transcript_13645/g.16928 Transcript_13645/m.16928 type:complete len:121 (-) Transcript_13645:429-791(-)
MRLAHSNPGTKFPAIKAPNQLYPDPDGSSSALVNVNSTSKIDLKDLSWDDRERVLRLLFAKINAVQNQTIDKIINPPSENNGESQFKMGADSLDFETPHPPIFEGDTPPSVLRLEKPDIV